MTPQSEESVAKDPLLGRWTYRSLVSNPDIDVEFGDLEFGRGELLVEYICWGKFVGRLIFGDDYQFSLTGTVTPGDPPTVSFDGFGDAAESNGHHYEYFGSVMPLWPHDPRQRPTIVGSVIRAAPKKGGKDRPGAASAFIAIKHNDLPDPDEAKPDEAKPDEAPASAPTTSGSSTAPSGSGSSSGPDPSSPPGAGGYESEAENKPSRR